MSECMDGNIDEEMEGETERWINELNAWMDGLMEGGRNMCMDRCKNGWRDGGIAELINGRADEIENVWMDDLGNWMNGRV